MLRHLIASIAVLLFLGAGLRADVTFGPNPRALDNLSVFDATVPLRRAEWDALRKAGVRQIDLNATSIMRTELGRARKGDQLVKRLHGTFLTDVGLAHLRARVAEGFKINYQAGIGLSADRCAFLDPVALGQRAAMVEYDEIIALLHRAGIPVAEINVDGPFLRLLGKSGKSSGCALGVQSQQGDQVSRGAEGKSIAFTAIAVHEYLKTLRAAVAEGQSRPPVMGLTINLPNWPVGPLKSASWPGFDVQLSDMLETFRSVPGSHLHGLGWITLDYPHCYLAEIRRCGGGSSEDFARKAAVLWEYTRRLNGTSRPPALGAIANDIGGVAACMPPNGNPKFLVYRDYKDGYVSRNADDPGPDAYTAPPTACQIAQRDGPDARFIATSFEYARSLQSGTLARALRAKAPEARITRVSFQSWGLTPMSNLWYMNQIRNFAQSR